MDSGKIASQAIHAARISLLRYIEGQPHRLREFISLNSCGTVVVLVSKNLRQLEVAHAQALAANLPTALFVDSGHIPVVWLPAKTTDQADNATIGAVTGGTDNQLTRSSIYPPSETQRCLNSHFNGEAVTTALAIGPASRDLIRHLTKKFQCVR